MRRCVNVCAAVLLLGQLGCAHLFYDTSGPRTCEHIETTWEPDAQGVLQPRIIEYGCEMKGRQSGAALLELVGVVIGILALLL